MRGYDGRIVQRRHALHRIAFGFAGCALCEAAAAQAVLLSGLMGENRALLVIDGAPQVLAVGASARGVTLRRVGDGMAEVEVGGRMATLRLGGAPARLAGGGSAGGEGSGEIVLPVGTGGHVMAQGQINGKAVRFMVDTGATTIALSAAEAQRIGLDYKGAPMALTHTAGGTVPVHRVMLSSVRLGEVEVSNVAAVVLAAEMPFVLLGNSFLSRFTMRRDDDTMRLRKKP